MKYEELVAALLNVSTDVEGIRFPLLEEEAKEVAQAILNVVATGGPVTSVPIIEGEQGCVLRRDFAIYDHHQVDKDEGVCLVCGEGR